MRPRLFTVIVVLGWLASCATGSSAAAATATGEEGAHAEAHDDAFPVPITEYEADEFGASLSDILRHRIEVEPFNLVATLIFVGAVLHTFFAPKIMHKSHELKHAHELRVAALYRERKLRPGEKPPVSFKAEVLHFFGEVEAIFGIWVLPLLISIIFFRSWHTAEEYLAHGVNYTEPIFVVVIMAIAASRPILRLAEDTMAKIANLGRGTPVAWWLTILTIGPLLGSFITEPAAMTISAMLLLENFYRLNPPNRLKYATLGLLFVNVSVGGTLTHFAAPPVLMVAGKWDWGLSFMFFNFGWKAVVGIGVANVIYFLIFRRDFAALAARSGKLSEHDVAEGHWASRRDRIPVWTTVVHVAALAWTVLTAHYTALYLGGFLVFLAFTQATQHHQNPIQLRSPILVGFFLAGLVVHGTLQAWWIGPVLGSLAEVPLMLGATVLTAFNDNAAITYLATLVPNFGPEMKYAVVAGAVTGGGLTVIANAPNPAGQSILGKVFGDGISPIYLMFGALIPTVIMGLAFMLLPS